jgi:hypothetical protein
MESSNLSKEIEQEAVINSVVSKKGVLKPNLWKVDRPSKEELQKLLWEVPTTSIARNLGVSDKAVEKWSKLYGLAKPPRGYWAKRKAGTVYMRRMR